MISNTLQVLCMVFNDDDDDGAYGGHSTIEAIGFNPKWCVGQGDSIMKALREMAITLITEVMFHENGLYDEGHTRKTCGNCKEWGLRGTNAPEKLGYERKYYESGLHVGEFKVRDLIDEGFHFESPDGEVVLTIPHSLLDMNVCVKIDDSV